MESDMKMRSKVLIGIGVLLALSLAWLCVVAISVLIVYYRVPVDLPAVDPASFDADDDPMAEFRELTEWSEPTGDADEADPDEADSGEADRGGDRPSDLPGGL